VTFVQPLEPQQLTLGQLEEKLEWAEGGRRASLWNTPLETRTSGVIKGKRVSE